MGKVEADISYLFDSVCGKFSKMLDPQIIMSKSQKGIEAMKNFTELIEKLDEARDNLLNSPASVFYIKVLEIMKSLRYELMPILCEISHFCKSLQVNSGFSVDSCKKSVLSSQYLITQIEIAYERIYKKFSISSFKLKSSIDSLKSSNGSIKLQYITLETDFENAYKGINPTLQVIRPEFLTPEFCLEFFALMYDEIVNLTHILLKPLIDQGKKVSFDSEDFHTIHTNLEELSQNCKYFLYFNAGLCNFNCPAQLILHSAVKTFSDESPTFSSCLNSLETDFQGRIELALSLIKKISVGCGIFSINSNKIIKR